MKYMTIAEAEAKFGRTKFCRVYLSLQNDGLS